MTSVKAAAFDERVAQCSRKTREMIAFLMAVAEHSGSLVEPPTFEARGVGVTYWTRGRRFCRFDPKHKADHVGVLVPGADRSALKAAGEVSPREDGEWVVVENMRGAVRLVPLILSAYDARAIEGTIRANRQRTTHSRP